MKDSPDDLLTRATHEAGHALMTATTEAALLISATIQGGDLNAGHVSAKWNPNVDGWLQAKLLACMGGLAGEHVGLKKFDLDRAGADLDAALFCLDHPQAFQCFDYEAQREPFTFTTPGRKNRILLGAFLISTNAIMQRKQAFDKLVIELLRQKTLTGEQVYEIVRNKKPENKSSLISTARRKLNSIFGI